MPLQTPLLDNLHEAVSAWFLGPQAENFSVLEDLFERTLNSQTEVRREYALKHGDPVFITPEMQQSQIFQDNRNFLKERFKEVLDAFNRYSVPFFSPRYAGHMNMETTLPAVAGMVSTILFNPNNVTFEASPITTMVELSVGKELCEMLGYDVKDDEGTSTKPTSWGHLPSDGTLANLQSMWYRRPHLYFYPLALRAAMEDGEPLAFVADSFEVHPCAAPDKSVLFRDLSAWDLLNLRVDEILSLGDRLHEQYGISATFLTATLDKFIIQSTSKDVLVSKFQIEEPPQYLLSNTKHYSWPKSAAILGIGSDNCVNVPVDNDARLDIVELRKALQDRLERKQAVYAVVAMLGTTEEGAVDSLVDILALRDEFQTQGLSFVVHVDAAWGGYFASMIRPNPSSPYKLPADPPDVVFVPTIALRESTVLQIRALRHADSITIDPHKSGYIPYPAGGLCYRDGRMRFLLTWSAPYLHDAFESIGSYGVEGSKAGAPAMATHLHHQVIGLHKEGHGALLGQASFTCRRMFAHWAAMSDATTPFVVVPFNPLINDDDPEKLEEEKRFIRENILGRENLDVIRNPTAMKELCAIGSDLNINTFACNFRINGQVNEDVEEANYLNNRIFDRLSVTAPNEEPIMLPLFLSASVFGIKDYGKCVENYKRRLGLETESKQDLFVLRNVVMSPFQSAGNYLPRIASAFQEILQDEIKNVVWRNTLAPQTHCFTMQGTDQLFLTYRPLFRKANGRLQLIVSATFADAREWKEYLMYRNRFPDSVFSINTEGQVLLSDILRHQTLKGVIIGGPVEPFNVVLSDIRVIKQRPLDSRWRDPEYPLFAPFYLYGTTEQQHIDHMLLRAPNAQLSADKVELNLDKKLPKEELERGALLMIDRQEVAMQPFNEENPPSFFIYNATFNVTVYRDPREAVAHGPGLASINETEKLASGTMQLSSKAIYVDYMELNTEDFVSDGRIITDYTSAKAPRSIKELWSEVAKEKLNTR
ncbi:PLP-dependent transferase [Gloeopeniophorella convolvens]|nr:PLP-dependent transferase [Gloeopeniophorella convolvens]